MNISRELSPAGAGADQIWAPVDVFWPEGRKPPTRVPPLMTGCAPGAAVQVTVWPLVPESRASRASGCDSE
jgi:hypothetical protein